MPKASSTRPSIGRNRKQKQHQPENANEFLAAGVTHEEAAEKWRAGDAAKSFRFFARAIETYDQGLRQFPDSFDLNYNKARVQYEISQNPALLAEYATDANDLLEVALESHRKALRLDTSNADILFNTAQVIVSLVEVNVKDKKPIHSALLMEEALSLFQKCLEIQETSFEQGQVDHISSGGVSLLDQGSSRTEETDKTSVEHEVSDGSWASIVEPVTNDAVLETVVGMLDVIASLSEMDSGERSVSLDDLERVARLLVERKIQHYVEGSSPDSWEETLLVTAKVKAALLDAKFHAAEIDLEFYDSQLKEVFNALEGISLKKPAALLLHAEALVAFADSIRSSPNTAVLQWTRLKQALDSLKEASGPQDIERSISVNLMRGDIELLRFALSRTSGLPESLSSTQVQTTLLKNAEVYYRGASSLVQKLDAPKKADRLLVAKVKEAVAASMGGGGDELLRRLLEDGFEEADIQEVISSMAEELSVDEQILGSCSISS